MFSPSIVERSACTWPRSPGQIKIFQEANRTLNEVGELHLPHGHTVAVDSKTHLVYFPLEDFDGKAVLRIMK